MVVDFQGINIKPIQTKLQMLLTEAAKVLSGCFQPLLVFTPPTKIFFAGVVPKHSTRSLFAKEDPLRKKKIYYWTSSCDLFFGLSSLSKFLPTNKLNQLPWCKRFQGVFPVQGTEPNKNHFPNLQLSPPQNNCWMMIQDDPWMIPHGSHPEIFFSKQGHTPWAKEPKELPQNSLMTNHPKVRQKTRFVEGDFNPFEKN